MKLTPKYLKKGLALLLSLILCVTALPFAAVTASADEPEDHYLFAYFTGNTAAQQQIRFAVSTDGLNFDALNGNQAIFQAKRTNANNSSGCARDPYVFRAQDGSFYMLATDMDADGIHRSWNGDTCMYVWHSQDLVTWNQIADWDVAASGAFEGVDGYGSVTIGGTDYSLQNTIRMWAPQFIWDDTQNAYMVYWGNYFSDWNSAILYCYTTDFIHYSAPQVLFKAATGAAIDSDIIYDSANHIYYHYYKDETTAGIKYATATNLSGPYTDGGLIIANTDNDGYALEGSNCHFVNGTLTMFIDSYTRGDFVVLQADNFEFENYTKLTSGTDYSINQLDPRHASVIQITETEYNRLVNAYGITTSTDVTYNFTKEYSRTATDWEYYTYNDSNKKGIDVMYKESGSSFTVNKGSGYATLINSTFFVNDADVRAMIPDDVYTVSFDYSLENTNNLSPVVFGLGTGAGAPSEYTDYLMIFGNGDIWIKPDATNTDTHLGNFPLTVGVSYHYDIVSNGTTITFYRDGEKLVSYDATIAFPSTGVRYASFGFSDGHSSAGYGNGSYANIRFRDSAVSESQIVKEYNDGLIMHRVDSGNGTYDGMSDALDVSGDTNGTRSYFAGETSSSYSVSGWINPGSSVGGNNTILALGAADTWDPTPYGRYMALHENGDLCFNFCNGNKENDLNHNSEHSVDISQCFGSSGLSANTWYFVQINLVPSNKNTTRIMVWVNGVNTINQSVTLKTKINGSTDSTDTKYDYGMLSFMAQSTQYLSLGGLLRPTWWKGDGSSYVKDVRVCSQALDPEEAYHTAKCNKDAAVARTYVENNIGDISSVPSFSTTPYHMSDPININAYKNYIFAGGTSFSGDGSGNNYWGVGRTSFKAIFPRYSVVVYDGARDTIVPVMLETYSNDTSGSSQLIRYVSLYNNSDFYLGGKSKDETVYAWRGYTRDYTRWVGNIAFTAEEEFGVADGVRESPDSQRDSTTRFWWNKLVYSGSGNSTDYYSHYNNIQFYTKTAYKNSGSSSHSFREGAFTSLADTYVINYKPVYDIVRGTTVKVPNTNYTAYNYYNSVVSGNEWLYTEDSLNQYYVAMYYVIKSDPNNYSYSYNSNTGENNVDATVRENASDIKAAAKEFPKINLVKKQFTVTYNYANGTTITQNVTAGETIPSVPANTPTAHIDGTLTHNVYTWPAAVTAGYMPTADITFNEITTPTACSFDNSESEGIRTFTCSVCDYSYNVDVSGYYAAVTSANGYITQTHIYNNSDLSALSSLVTTNNATVAAATDQDTVDTAEGEILEAIDSLRLRQYSITVNTYLDNVLEETEVLNNTYGEIQDVQPHEDYRSYDVLKWTYTTDGGETTNTLNSASKIISYVVKGDATFNAYSTDENATVGDNEAKLILVGNSNQPTDVQYITKGTHSVSVESNVITIGSVTITAPVITFYNIVGFKIGDTVFNTEDSGEVTVNSDTVITPVYTANNTISVTLSNCYLSGKPATENATITSVWKDRLYITDDGTTNNTKWNMTDAYANTVCIGYGKSVSMRVTGTATITHTEDTPAPTVEISYFSYGIYKANTTTVAGCFYLPEGYTYVKAGVILKTDRSTSGYSSTNNYTSSTTIEEGQLLVSNKSGVFAANNLTDGRQYHINVSRTANTKFIMGARAYLTYTDGVTETTIYSPLRLIAYAPA